MADALDSSSVARHNFEVARRGYEQQEVRAFLHEVSSLLERLQREGAELRERAERAEARLSLADEPDEAMLLQVLGEETTRVLTSARDASTEIRTKAEAAAERLIADATLEAAEARAEAVQGADRRVADAVAESERLLSEASGELDRRRAEAAEAASRIHEEASAQAQTLRDEVQRELDQMQAAGEEEREAARTQGRETVAEAQAVRERVLRDLAVRRKKARKQVERLNAGRERLMQAYAVVRRTVDEATEELNTSLADARLAADAAGRRIEGEADPTVEQLDEEIATGALVDLPIAELVGLEPDDADREVSSTPFSGEVPTVEVISETPPVDSSLEAVDPHEPRGRKGRRRKGDVGRLPASTLTPIEPPSAGEGIRILADPAVEPEPVAPEPEAEQASSPAPEPEPDPVSGEPAPEAPEPGPAEVAAASSAEGDDTDGATTASVQDLVERLRAEQSGGEAGTAPSHAVDGPTAEAAEEVTEVEVAPVDPDTDLVVDTPFTVRDEALASVDKELGRRLKRALADEQNEVLDRLRRAKPTGVDDLLPVPDEHASRWADVASSALADAAAAGAMAAGGSAGSVADVADELARSLTSPLRDRVDRSFAASDGNLDEVTERVRALYREWKGQRLADSSRHWTAAAYARGIYDGLGADTELRWVLDPQGGPCPDCDDNVLGGTVTKGAEFPTGHQCAPAHPGCRCLVLPAEG